MVFDCTLNIYILILILKVYTELETGTGSETEDIDDEEEALICHLSMLYGVIYVNRLKPCGYCSVYVFSNNSCMYYLMQFFTIDIGYGLETGTHVCSVPQLAPPIS